MEASAGLGTISPLLFVSHGSPMVAADRDDYTEALAGAAALISKPQAVVTISAHWQVPGPIRVTSAAHPALIYDFYGFPPKLYELQYPAPGSPSLASECIDMLSAAGFDAIGDPGRGFDHGAWVPLRLIFPAADTPVVQISLPARPSPARLLKVGRALAPLRRRGILIFASGGIVHNLRMLNPVKSAPAAQWAVDFDSWMANRLEHRQLHDLVSYRESAPNAALAVPTTDHLDPLFAMLGAMESGDRFVSLYKGFQYGSISMRSFWMRS